MSNKLKYALILKENWHLSHILGAKITPKKSKLDADIIKFNRMIKK